MADLSTQPYKGTRDFYPADSRLARYLFGAWSKVAERFGYEQYEGPLLELSDLYRAKSGEELVNEQTYSFTDRGGREVTIRPELTPTTARMVAARQQELAYPLRWYAIGNFWRYERPQHGRLREFWQLNVDLIGAEGAEADAEIIRVADSIMRALGATPDMYTIRLNNRKLLSLLMGEYLGLDIEQSHLLSKLLDRKAKMSEVAFTAQAKTIVGEDSDKLMDLLQIDKIENLPANVVESGQGEELRQLYNKLAEYGIKNVQFDLTLMRGFDYYTGMVFEVFDTDPANARAIFGGGRYDELTGIFGAPDIPAVGFGLGDVTLADFLKTHLLLPSPASSTKVYVVVLGDYLVQAQQLASSLRKAGINVAVDISARKAGEQVKKAVKDQIPYALFVGEEEVTSKKYTLKNLAKESEQKLTLAQLTKTLQN